MRRYPRTGEGPLVLVLHGPNLGALGRRDPGHYGALDLDQIMDRLAKLAGELGLAVEGLQSDAEGDLVEALLAALGLPVGGVRLEPDRVLRAMATDKKQRQGLRLVLLRRPGEPEVVTNPDRQVLVAAIRSLEEVPR